MDRDIEEDKRGSYKTGKGVIKFFGYKHQKSMHVFAQLLKCVRYCFEEKYEKLNNEMHFFLKVKSEV